MAENILEMCAMCDCKTTIYKPTIGMSLIWKEAYLIFSSLVKLGYIRDYFSDEILRDLPNFFFCFFVFFAKNLFEICQM